MTWNEFRPLLLTKRSTWWRRLQGCLQNQTLERKIWYISFTSIHGHYCHNRMHMCILLFGLLVKFLQRNIYLWNNWKPANWATFVPFYQVQDDICSLNRTVSERSNNLQTETTKLHDFTSSMKEQWEGYMKKTEEAFQQNVSSIEQKRGFLAGNFQQW